MTGLKSFLSLTLGATFVGAVALISSVAPAAAQGGCPVDHAQLTNALQGAAPDGAVNGGLDNNMWAVVVNREGIVCNVTRTDDLNAQWPLSRVIAAQKAHTAWGLSLDSGTGGTVDTLSTANLWAATQPGGSLWELTQSNPVDTAAAYAGNFAKYGTQADPLEGESMGGVNVFGGGLALYDAAGSIVGGLGVSGDTSCADHNVAWRARDALGLDFVPSGLSGADGDNIIFDIQPVSGGMGNHADHPATVSSSGFGHPTCGFGEDAANATIVAACLLGDGTTPNCTAL
jgi:uncharacterized protein GlcG (DUF336 family)